MARRVFFSFHYQRDIWRVNVVRNSNMIEGASAAGWHDASLWEEAKSKGDASLRRLIDGGLANTSATVVCIGAKTAGRRWINYEIEKSIERGNRILGLRIHGIRDSDGLPDVPGQTPQKLIDHGVKIIDFTSAADLGKQVEALFQPRIRWI